MRRPRVAVLPGLVATLFILASCAPAAAPPAAAPTAAPAAKQPAASKPAAKSNHPPAVQELLSAAEAAGETEVKIVYTAGDYGGEQGINEFQAAFNRLYGTNITINFTPGPDKNDRLAATLQEVAAGRTPSTDVVLLSPSHFGELFRAEAMESYDWTQLSPSFKPEMVANNNIAIEVNTRTPGISYNKDLIPEDQVPAKLTDVFRPEWKGKLTSHQRAAQLDTIAYRPEWGPEKFTEYVCQLSDWIGGVTGGEPERLASGEFLMMVVAPGAHDVFPAIAAGAPLGFVIPEDGATLSSEYAGVPKGAENPNLAKLYINMLLSEEGQKIMYKHTFLDHSDLPGSQSAEAVNAVKAKGVEFMRANVQFELDHPEKGDLGDRYVDILNKKESCS